MKAWIARDENGALFLYGCKPYKYQADEESKVIFDSEDGHFMRVENENAYPEVTFENSPQMVEISSEDEPDYWTKLEHQYAGMAMQGVLMNEQMQIVIHDVFGKNKSMDVTISEFAANIAHTLVEKLKEKEKRV